MKQQSIPQPDDPKNIKLVSLNDEELTVNKIIAVTRHFARVEPFTGPKRKKVEEMRKYVEEHWFNDSAQPRYGFNTGIGSLKNVKISQENIEKFQELYVKSHSVGVGDPLDVEIVRGAMLLQSNALAKGYSGVRAEIIDKLIEMLNKRIHPVVPEQGSLGASGDLAPLTHITSVLAGEDEAEVWVSMERQKVKNLKFSDEVLKFFHNGEEVTFQTIRLQGKEAVSLTNSTAMMLSMAVHLIYDVEILLKNADISAALSLEAMMCEKDAFSEDLHNLRNQVGQINTADNIRNMIHNSKRMSPEARLAYFQYITEKQFKKDSELENSVVLLKKYMRDHEFEKDRVQDAYSLRCVPQVHGACKDAFHFVKNIVEREIRAVTDNPVIFLDKNGAGYKIKSGGNFHGEPLALAMDYLGIALAEIGSISERRLYRLLSPSMNFGLPRNLSGGEIGLNTGYMIVQYTAAQLVSENKILAHPASVDTIPTSDNQEDHVSMGLTAARKAQNIEQNVQYLIAMEYLCAIQGLHLSCQYESVSLEKFPLGRGSAAAFEFIRKFKVESLDKTHYPFQLMKEDEYLQTKIETMQKLSSEGVIVKAVEKELELFV
ncbi:MAG: histidine ammonia-lyase [bacterium]